MTAHPNGLPEAAPAVALMAVHKAFTEGGRDHAVLRSVDLTIRAGEFVALLGRSGSGKTTLLNLIAGIDRPTNGSVRVLGSEIGNLAEPAVTLFRRRHLGFVFQFFNLIPTLTVLENVALPVELAGTPTASRSASTGEAAPLPDAGARALELLRQVGLVDRADSFPDRLSGGEQQRVAIARALATDPPLILADEPTGNLDAESGDQVLALLLGLTRSRERTLLMATHSHAVAAQADRVLRVEEGRLVDRTVEVRRELLERSSPPAASGRGRVAATTGPHASAPGSLAAALHPALEDGREAGATDSPGRPGSRPTE